MIIEKKIIKVRRLIRKVVKKNKKMKKTNTKDGDGNEISKEEIVKDEYFEPKKLLRKE